MAPPIGEVHESKSCVMRASGSERHVRSVVLGTPRAPVTACELPRHDRTRLPEQWSPHRLRHSCLRAVRHRLVELGWCPTSAVGVPTVEACRGRAGPHDTLRLQRAPLPSALPSIDTNGPIATTARDTGGPRRKRSCKLLTRELRSGRRPSLRPRSAFVTHLIQTNKRIQMLGSRANSLDFGSRPTRAPPPTRTDQTIETNKRIQMLGSRAYPFAKIRTKANQSSSLADAGRSSLAASPSGSLKMPRMGPNYRAVEASTST